MFDAVILGLAALLVVDGLLALASGRGLVGRIFPPELPVTRILGGLVYMLIGGLFLYLGWHGWSGR